MQLVDIKSRDKTPITINMEAKDYGATSDLAGMTILRTVEVLDKVSGEIRAKNIEVRCPPVVRWPAGGVVKGLPASVLDHPVIKGLLARHAGRRPKLQVVQSYDSTPPASPVSPSAKKTRRSRR